MKKLLLSLLLLLSSQRAFAAYALVANTGAGSSDSGNSVTTGSINTTGADLLVIGISDYVGGGSSGTCTPTDSKTNTWTAGDEFTTGVGLHVKLWYSQGGTACTPTSDCFGTGHTFSCSSTGSAPTITVSAWSGSVATPLDQHTGAQADGVSSLQPGNITPTENNELVISIVEQNVDTGNVTQTGLTAELDDIAAASGQHAGGAMGHTIQTTATAINPTWTAGGTTGIATVITSFKAAAGGGTGQMLLLGVQ